MLRWNMMAVSGSTSSTSISGEGDFGALFEAKARARVIDQKQGSVTLGYDVSQRSHFEFPDLDRQSHRLSVDSRMKVGPVELGGSYDSG